MDLLHRPEGQLAAALALGLAIGAERERRRAHVRLSPSAGVRTFALVALLGSVLSILGSVALLTVGAVFVSYMALRDAITAHGADGVDPGLTTEVALLLTYCLGALTHHAPAVAFGAGLVTAMLLALRGAMHAAVRSLLSDQELIDALVFGVSAAVVLPIIPDRTIDPWGAVNPFVLWRLVVLIMAMSGLGYIAQRALGPRFGLALAGFGSGFVSSSATIAAMGARAREQRELRASAVAGAAASTVATFIELAAVIGTSAPSVLRALRWPLLAAGGTALVYAALCTVLAARTRAEPERGRAFRFRTAVLFAGLVSVIALVSTLAQRSLGRSGALVAAALGGLADVHAAGAAVASLVAHGTIDQPTASLAIVIGVTTNTGTKMVMALMARAGSFAWWVILGVALVLGAMWAALLVAGGLA
jgi:uncharacterized membrane protein (DUF4010 family)